MRTVTGIEWKDCKYSCEGGQRFLLDEREDFFLLRFLLPFFLFEFFREDDFPTDRRPPFLEGAVCACSCDSIILSKRDGAEDGVVVPLVLEAGNAGKAAGESVCPLAEDASVGDMTGTDSLSASVSRTILGSLLGTGGREGDPTCKAATSS